MTPGTAATSCGLGSRGIRSCAPPRLKTLKEKFQDYLMRCQSSALLSSVGNSPSAPSSPPRAESPRAWRLCLTSSPHSGVRPLTVSQEEGEHSTVRCLSESERAHAQTAYFSTLLSSFYCMSCSSLTAPNSWFTLQHRCAPAGKQGIWGLVLPTGQSPTGGVRAHPWGEGRHCSVPAKRDRGAQGGGRCRLGLTRPDACSAG